MKPQETKNKFIQLRAENKSYTYIARELQISKSTCSEWEKAFKEEIAQLKQDQLNELYDNYYMTKKARIQQLGGTLERINEALYTADYREMAPDKLLDFKLKYTEALKGEYTSTSNGGKLPEGDINPKTILQALNDLLTRIQAGEVTQEQANKESTVLANILRAYDSTMLQAKVEQIEAQIIRR